MSLPSPFPGETVFSFTARAMLRSSVRSRKHLLRRMGVRGAALWSPFGVGASGLFRAFPELNTFLAPADFIWLHTTSPLLVAFSGRVTNEEERVAFCDRALATSGWLVGPHSCRCLRPHGLRECPVCREDDIREYGLAYWHREHQVRAVSLCWRHGVLLREHLWRPGLGFELELPGFGRYATAAPALQSPPMSSVGLDAWMAKAVAGVLQTSVTSGAYVRQLLTVEVAAAGLYSRNMPNLKEIHSRILEMVGAPYLESLGYATEYSPKRGARFARAVCRRNSELDPVLTLLFAASLGLPHDALIRRSGDSNGVASPAAGTHTPDESTTARIRDALESNDYVLSRAAASLGVSWSKLTTMIASHGIVCPIVTGANAKFGRATIDAMIDALKRGDTWADIKRRFGCGDHHLGTLKIYDATLREVAAGAQRERLIDRYRRSVAAAFACNPRPSRTEVRTRLVTEVSYLEHHDKVWLRSQFGRVPRRRRIQSVREYGRADDQELDNATVQTLRCALAQAQALEPPRRLTRTLLLRVGGIPASIYPKLTSSRLPQTCTFLAANEESPASYLVRRLEFALSVLAREARPVTLIRLRRVSGLTELKIIANRDSVRRLVFASGLPVSTTAVAWLRAGGRR